MEEKGELHPWKAWSTARAPLSFHQCQKGELSHDLIVTPLLSSPRSNSNSLSAKN